MTASVPYWRLSSFYWFYFAALGAFLPYWSLYLESLGYTAAVIGQLMALMMATKIVSPNIWGWIADHTGQRVKIVRLGSLAAALAYAGVLLGNSFWWLALVMIVFSFFWNAVLPQFEVTTLNHLGAQPQRYSRVRLWGSVGFILTVGGLGYVLDGYGMSVLPWAVLALFAGIWLASLVVPEEGVRPEVSTAHEPLRKVLARPSVFALLGVCFLMQTGHGVYYGFYSIYLQEHGYTRALTGQLWALGVIAEVLVFLAMHALVSRFGLRRLLLASLALAALRWLLIGWCVEWLPVLVLAQLLHAASFGLYHGTAIQLIHRYFTGKHQGRGQALYSSLSFGAGGAAGALYSGFTWEAWGAVWTYTGAAAITVAAFVIAWFAIRPAEVAGAAPHGA